MFSTKWIKIAVTALMVTLAAPVLAHDDGFFLGIEAGYGFVSKVPGSTSMPAGRAVGGYQLIPYLSGEVGILGNLDSIYILDGSLRATLPFTNEMRMFVKGGVAEFYDSSFDSFYTTVTYGAGVGYGVTCPFSIDLSYQGYGGDRNVHFVSLGFSYHLK